MSWSYYLGPQDEVEWFLAGAIVACMAVAVMEKSAAPSGLGPDDRPEYAILDQCDLHALAAGDEQTVQTGQGQVVRLAAVGEGDDSDE